MILDIAHTFFLASSKRSARSQARWIASHSASVSCRPDVVVAVTTTLMIIAGGKTPAKSTLVRSLKVNSTTGHKEESKEHTSLFLNALTERMNIVGSVTNCSSSGNLGA